jgi:hypothetical protein
MRLLMAHPAGWHEDSVDRRPDELDEPTFDLVRSKPRERVNPSGLVWRAPTQIAQMRSQEAQGGQSAQTRSAQGSEPDRSEIFASGLAPRRRARRIVAKVIGVLLLLGSFAVAYRVIASSPKMRAEALSWITLGHPQEADRAWQAAEAKVRRLLKM